MSDGPSRRRFRDVDRVVLGFTAAVFVFGITFGVLAQAAGISIAQTIVMSALIFAGAAQFALVAAIASGATLWFAGLTAALLNLRLFALGIAVAPALRGSRLERFLQSYLVTDESVAVASDVDGSIERDRFLATGIWIAAAWVLGTAVGAFGGVAIEDPLALGLDAAFPAGFIALLAPRLREDRVALKVALLGAAICVVLTPLVPVGVAPLVASGAALLSLRN